MSKEAMKLALEALENINNADNDRDFLGPEECCDLDNAITALREALAQQALDKMAENARELGLDYEPAQVQVPAKDSTYGYAKSLAEAIFKQHFASDEHYASGRIVWGVNDTVIGILTQIDNMVADMVRRPAQQEPVGEVLNERGEVDWISFVPAIGTYLYTRPQAREPLTDDEIHDIYDEVARREPYNMAVTRRNIARAVEAKLREKNA